MRYKVVSIKHIDGTTRMDGRYPLRVGRECEFIDEPVVGMCLYLEWIKNPDGTPYHGFFRTSLVKQIERTITRTINDNQDHIVSTVVVTTCNSIYTFESVSEGV